MFNLKLNAMDEKLITIVVLPYSKAHILKMQLEAKNIECDLEEIDVIEGSSSSTVRVKILENQIDNALPVLEDLLGVKPFIVKPQADKKERHILVPIDFSENSEKACRMAYNIARKLQIKLVFMHCYINPIIHSMPFSDVYSYDSSLLTKLEYIEEESNNKFQEFMSKMATEIGTENWKLVSPEYIIKSGYAEEDIVSFAHKNRSQLIVMGSGSKTDSGGTLGSVAADVMYNARVPVLVVPEDVPAQSLSQISNILYATNFDEKDFAVVDKLMGLLKSFNIKLICAHVGQPKGNGWDLARLEGMKDVLHKKYKEVEFECKLIVGNDILESLDKFIAEEKIGLLSLTTHKRNMITRLFNPSLAKKMIFHAQTPLLIFHA